MRQDIIVDIVQERYGTDHNRIFRLLLCSTYLEEKKTSESSCFDRAQKDSSSTQCSSSKRENFNHITFSFTQ